MLPQRSQTEAVSEVVADFFVAIGEPSSKENVVEYFLNVALINLVLLLRISDHVTLVNILSLRLDVWGDLVDLPEEGAFEEPMLKEEDKDHSNMDKRLLEASNLLESTEQSVGNSPIDNAFLVLLDYYWSHDFGVRSGEVRIVSEWQDLSKLKLRFLPVLEYMIKEFRTWLG